MIRLAWLAVLALMVLGGFVVAATVPAMPDPVASRFGADGAAAATMPRENYLVLMLLLVAFVPGSVLVLAGWWPGRPGQRIRVGSKHVDPARAEAAKRLMRAFAVTTAALVTVFMVGVHLLVVEAHKHSPPALPLVPFYVALAIFLALMLGAAAMLVLRLRRWAR